jgi:cytidine deaminase
MTDADLIAAALAVRQHAYAPYSNYPVGAALLAASGRVYAGCNVESASFGATVCAERAAIVKAISEGDRQFEAIAVVTHDGGAPCGICRQLMLEFSPTMLVLIADTQGNVRSARLQELLPDGFTLEHGPR